MKPNMWSIKPNMWRHEVLKEKSFEVINDVCIN